MRKWILFSSALISSVAWAKLPKQDWEVQSGQLTYHVSYPLKKVDGTAKNVKGKGHCEKGLCQFLIAVPVKSFESGDGNRDNHMLQATKAALNPMIVVKVNFPEDSVGKAMDTKAEITFAGKTKNYDHVQIKTTIASNGTATTTGTLPLVLTDFEVERPSLLGIEIDDSVPVDFELSWK